MKKILVGLSEWYPYPENYPSICGTNYIVIIHYMNTYSYAIRNYDDDCKFRKEFDGEIIVAFTQTDPNKIVSNYQGVYIPDEV